MGRLTRQDAMQAQQLNLEVRQRKQIRPEPQLCIRCAGAR